MQREAAQALQRKRGQESMEQVHQQRFTEQESQHDACGIGAVVNISGQRTHRAVDDALKIVEKLEHRSFLGMSVWLREFHRIPGYIDSRQSSN